MRSFVRKTLSFGLVFLLLMLGLDVLSDTVVSTKSKFDLSPDISGIILGHSQPECAYNDSLIVGFRNLSQSGESYFYTYFKATQVIQSNATLKVVLVEFTNNQLLESRDEWIWGSKYLDNKYPTYAPFLDMADELLLFQHNPTGYINVFSLSQQKNITRMVTNNYSYSMSIGGYKHLTYQMNDSSSRVNEKSLIEAYGEKGLSHYNLLYLRKLLEACRKQGLKVILVRSPMHERALRHTDEMRFREVLNSLGPSVEFLDFSKFHLADSDFSDLLHLNLHGAKLYSEWFNGLLKNGLLEKSDKQAFVDSEIDFWRRGRNVQQISSALQLTESNSK